MEGNLNFIHHRDAEDAEKMIFFIGRELPPDENRPLP